MTPEQLAALAKAVEDWKPKRHSVSPKAHLVGIYQAEDGIARAYWFEEESGDTWFTDFDGNVLLYRPPGRNT